jgi:hypothetical protein
VRTNHAPFKSAAEVALHARRVHTLDAAERREVKHLEKITRLERALADARRDGETLRRAADVLKESLEETLRETKTLASRHRKRKSEKLRGDDDVYRDGTSGDARDDDGATTGTSTGTSTGTTKQKEKKPYTLSASNVLRVAEQAAAAARRAVAEREETGTTPPRRRRKG